MSGIRHSHCLCRRNHARFTAIGPGAAALLFDQAVRLRFHLDHGLAAGDLFNAVMIVPHALTFPGS